MRGKVFPPFHSRHPGRTIILPRRSQPGIVSENGKDSPEFRKQLDYITKGTHPTTLSILDERGNQVNSKLIEHVEQAMAETYIEPSDVVLELGARYGSVSCRINLKLRDKTKQVSVEPDSRVWDALETNKSSNKCQFHIVKGCISKTARAIIQQTVANGYATTTIEDSSSQVPHFTLDEIKTLTGIDRFTVVFADCEGCLGYFLKENPTILESLRLFLFEADNPSFCDYDELQTILKQKGFQEIKGGFHSVWRNPLFPNI
jgi:FkbM family methyltransferase